MKTLKISAVLLLLTVSFTFAQSTWKFDKAHSRVGFSVSYLVITDVEGNFEEFEGMITSKGDDFQDATIEFTAEISSINTENEKRDSHLQSDDFFNAENFPQLMFKSKSFKKIDDKNYKLVGDLTMRDVTKEVELDIVYNGMVNDPWGNTKAGFSLKGEVNRFDYNLKWNKTVEAGGLVVSEEVTILANLTLVKQ